MKKLFLSFAVFSLAACSSTNDEETQTANASITGKWYLDRAEQRRSKNNETKIYHPTECEKKSIHEFRLTDMTSTIFESINSVCTQTDVVTRKYTYDPLTQKFWYEGEADYPYVISQLTATDMLIEDRIDDVDGDGIPDVTKRYFKRIN